MCAEVLLLDFSVERVASGWHGAVGQVVCSKQPKDSATTKARQQQALARTQRSQSP